MRQGVALQIGIGEMVNRRTKGMQRGQKLNALQRLLPEGLIASRQWLNNAGYSSAIRRKTVSHGWINQPPRGIYNRPGAETRWLHLVVSLQSIMRLPVSVGGLTALETAAMPAIPKSISLRHLLRAIDALMDHLDVVE